ncbi:MAG TPA: polysaccharide deacetylase family protein [Chitinophagaceae bacterium]|nr:polysaccharide deacetylase family protein [Chitinophagaceae bacterium]
MKTNKKKRLACISLDLDNQWSYMKIHGDEGWDKYPSYFDIFIPHILDVLDELDLKITFFIVGKDAESADNRKYLKMITDRGHETGNHSYHHESWLQTYSYDKIEKEIISAEEAISSATGQTPVGFRGPGFSWSPDLLEVLKKRNYLYDASTLPTWLGPLARMYYFWKSDLTKKEKKSRKELFGTFKDGLRSNKPYYHNLKDNKTLLEIPVTTTPVLRIPFHLSYLIYLSGISNFLMKAYLKTAIILCKATGTKPSYLLHPLDLIGGDKVQALAFFPGMNLGSDRKVKVFKYVIKSMQKHFELVPMSVFSKNVIEMKEKKVAEGVGSLV